MNDGTFDKILPCDLAVERTVLGHLMLSGIIDFDLNPEDLYLESHRKLFKAAKTLQENGKTPDMVMILSQLRTEDILEACGGTAYIVGLTDGIPQLKSGLAPQYVEIIREKSALRKLIQASNETMVRAYQAEEKFKDISGDLIAVIDQAHAALEPDVGPVSMSDAVGEAYLQVERIADMKQKGIQTGLSLGFSDLDRMIPAGVAPDDYMIIAARPGQGKTSLLLGILNNMAEAGKALMFFSIEMGRLMIMMRLLSIVSGVHLMKLLTGFVGREDWNRLGTAAGKMSQWRVWIDDSTGIHAHDMGARIRRLRQPIDGILLDYVQLLQPPKHLQRSNDEQKVAYNSMHLKFMAKSMKVPVIACAQLNRSSAKRKEGIPQLSDLRQSGQLEQDCDIAVLIHRDEDNEDDKGKSKLIIAKQRNGPTGELSMSFTADCSKFSDFVENDTERWYNT